MTKKKQVLIFAKLTELIFKFYFISQLKKIDSKKYN